MKGRRSYQAKKEEMIRKWYIADVAGKTLGRVATKVADVLRGKKKAIFTPNVDTGDFVILLNARQIKVTGNKEKAKTYFTHSGYHHGAKVISLEKMRQIHPERILYFAIYGMLPKGSLGRDMLKKLKIYNDEKHPHIAAKPEKLEI